MRPLKDESGNLRPDLDYREVSITVMAQYLGINKRTLLRRWIAGVYPPEGGRQNGAHTVYRPRVLLGIDRHVASR